MAAILHTAGPVSIRQVLASNWKHLQATGLRFKKAAMELEQLGFGSIVEVRLQKKGRSMLVFVKKHPEDLQSEWNDNMDLCTPDVYSRRFHSQVSRHITLNLRAALVAQGLVLKKHFM